MEVFERIAGVRFVGELPGPGPWKAATFAGMAVFVNPDYPPRVVKWINGEPELVELRLDELPAAR